MAFYWMDMQTFHTHFVVHHTLYIALCISWCKFECRIHHNKISNIKLQPTATQLNCNLHLQTSKPYPIHAPWNPRLNTCNIKSHHTSKWNLQIPTYRTSNRTKFARTRDQHACVNLYIRHYTPKPQQKHNWLHNKCVEDMGRWKWDCTLNVEEKYSLKWRSNW